MSKKGTFSYYIFFFFSISLIRINKMRKGKRQRLKRKKKMVMTKNPNKGIRNIKMISFLFLGEIKIEKKLKFVLCRVGSR